jgi:predicted glutamine amidotransferase
MCRFIAVIADRPAGLGPLLVSSPHALMRQSNCDRRGVCHDSGWGLGYYDGGRPRRVRSIRPAWDDPLFRQTAEAVRTRAAVAHVRLATIGQVAERNCHPFERDGWLFAHNGTLVGFAAEPGPLQQLIPEPFLSDLEGETDSEHIFRLLLARLRQQPPHTDDAADVVRRTVRELADLYPGSDDDPTRLNIVLTDSRVLAASRWGHWLYKFDQWGAGPMDGHGPVRADPVNGSGSEVSDRLAQDCGISRQPIYFGAVRRSPLPCVCCG